MVQGVHGGGFSNVDRTATPGAFVQYLDQLTAMEPVQRYKRESYRLAGARPGARILDVGCGAGDDVRALGALVGSTGLVTGIDSSATMIAEAQRRAEGHGLPVEFRVGDIYALDYPDASVDGCRADRVFQHLEDRPAALAELVRVLRPGGCVVVTDPDWETLIVDLPDRELIRKVFRFRCDGYRAGWSGRQTPRLMREQGLSAITVFPVTPTITDFAFADQIFLFRQYAAKAQEAGALTPDELATWLRLLDEADRAGTFFSAFTFFTVAGRK